MGIGRASVGEAEPRFTPDLGRDGLAAFAPDEKCALVGPAVDSRAMDYRVELPVFSGPMDLLLHLVKEREVDIHEIQIAPILEDYLKYLKILQNLDLNNVGEFLVLASELMEIKSRELLPREDVDLAAELDPRNDLIRRLLEFKRYRDMARKLARLGQLRDRMVGRGMPGADLPPEAPNEDVDLADVDVWTLLKTFARLMEETGHAREYTVRTADVPVQVYIQRVIDQLKGDRQVDFTRLFPTTAGREALVGTFLAVLELVKRGYLAVNQEERGYGAIQVEFHGPDTLSAEDLFRDGEVTVVQGG